MRTVLAACLAGFAALFGGCASSAEGDPALAAQAAEGYPDLREVPRATIANTDQAYWDAAARELLAAAAEMRANPRSLPGEPEDPAAFVDQARADLEATRQSHGSN